jgi:hypothetical protein
MSALQKETKDFGAVDEGMQRLDTVKLESREPSDYQVSIFEVVGTSTTEGEILRLENGWKEKLHTKPQSLMAL